MNKFTQMAVLLDIYGGLLTDKQQDVMDQYYNYDLSLQEIAENAGITKQGVHDLIRRAEHTLVKTDEKLGFINRLMNIQEGLEKVQQMLESENTSSKLAACQEKIESLINTCMGG
ncbi:MAG: sigma factor-like helix-turn-helix DNA-binding protein [Clostridia bacterium]|jgi:hypothetical protein|nr:sigma factor-like helix-turn-helix DNA-binding protein [Clostridia bacterium]